ncbi:RNA polymerase sigma factor [uncultured Mycobacterium sp.]|uniref:RNA polymerase sigma factor n=1 Tax=uncultured Mycobacterium sp. TaxID=171292 RepID=UPI0035CC74D3
MSSDVDAVLSGILREKWPRLVAVGMRILNDFQAAEDIAQETLLAALDHWPLSGVPDQPGAWMMTVCRRRALNALRDRQRQGPRLRSAAETARMLDSQADCAGGGEPDFPDDELRLIAMCCHPVLPFDARMALTLRMVGGLTTEEIAAAFHQPTATVAQRLVRAKKSLRSHRIGFADDDIDLPSRLPAVLDVLTLVFNEGYLAHSGADLTRADLAGESYRLTTLLTTIAPREGGPWALRALQSFHLSRSDTRVDDDGNLLTLDKQERHRWNRALIDDGEASLDRARQLCKPPTPLLLQAELAACHATAPTFEDTDWRRIVELLRPADDPGPDTGRRTQPRDRRGYARRPSSRPAYA